jgi:hypothetical protein
MHELRSWVERMDKMAAAREINPVFFWKLFAPRMWHLGVRWIFVYNSWIFWLHMCGEKEWIRFFCLKIRCPRMWSSEVRRIFTYLFLNSFAPHIRGNGYLNSDNGKLLYYLFHVRILNYCSLHFLEFRVSWDVYSHRRVYYLLEESIVPSVIICVFQVTECTRKRIVQYIGFHLSIFKPER